MKKSFALRLDEEVYEALERWSSDEFRSINGQIEWILVNALKKSRRMPKGPKPPQKPKDVNRRKWE